MFDKEAEEYSIGKAHEHYNYLFEEHAGSPADFARWCFQDGAKFGYHECKKEHEQEIERCNKLINDIIEIYPDIYKLWDFSSYPFLKITSPKEIPKKIKEWYVILNMNCKYEICRRCPKSGLFKGTYEECENWIKQKQKGKEND